jgi:PAS domain S-box-containing protein
MTEATTHLRPNEIKNSILDSLIMIAFAAGLPNLLIVIFITHKAGYFPYLSTMGIIILLFFALFRKKVPFLLKAWILISFGYFIGTIGLLREGLLSDGLLYFIFIGILSSMLINIRSGIIIMIVNLLTAGAIAFAISQGLLHYNLDIVAYFHSSATWLAFILTYAFFSALSVFIYGRLEKYLVTYINELTVKTEKLNRSNVQLEIEVEEKQLAEQQLKQSEIKFRNVFNSISDGIILLRQDYSILDINAGFTILTGLNKKDLIDNHFEALFADSGKLHDVYHTEQKVSSIFHKNEHQLKTLEKHKTIPVEVTLLPFQHDPELMHIALVKDVTENKENEIKIMNAVISSEEEERLRIARDLHDGIGPYLSAARMYINSLEIPDNDVKSLQIKKELTELMNLSISSIREISGNLGSHQLRSLGLNAAIANYIEKIKPEGEIKFELAIPDHFPFQENVEIAIYRVLVELINNSVKYGSPEKVTIRLEDAFSMVRIKYHENGIGFNVQEALKRPKGMGLYNIHSRISSLGGTLDFRSHPGKGVNVKITFIRSIACKPEEKG